MRSIIVKAAAILALSVVGLVSNPTSSPAAVSAALSCYVCAGPANGCQADPKWRAISAAAASVPVRVKAIPVLDHGVWVTTSLVQHARRRDD